ncbi:MAG: DUF1015 family protein [Blautia wexlerae]
MRIQCLLSSCGQSRWIWNLTQMPVLDDSGFMTKQEKIFTTWKKRESLIQDQSPSVITIYHWYEKAKTQTGIVGCSSIDDYMNGVVKKHELTREDREQDRIHHVDT